MGIDHTNPEVLRELYHEKGFSIKKIAGMSSVTQPTISYHFKKNGINTKSRKEVAIEHERGKPAHFRTDARGYERWYVTLDGSQKTVGVSRLLAVAEHGFEKVSNNHIHHKNKVPWDNRRENLEVLSESDHLRGHILGENSPWSKLSKGDVKRIKRRLGEDNVDDLANEFGVSKSAIRDIDKGRTWTHIQ